MLPKFHARAGRGHASLVIDRDCLRSFVIADRGNRSDTVDPVGALAIALALSQGESAAAVLQALQQYSPGGLSARPVGVPRRSLQCRRG